MLSTRTSQRKFVAPEIIFGRGSRSYVGQYAKQFNAQKALIVSDEGVINAGWLDLITESLDEERIPYHVFSNVTPNPRSTEVMDGAEVFEIEKCDIIIALGGGSPMDCAKGIGIVHSNRKNILTFEGVDNIRNPSPPLIFIPTTAGTSADVSQFCIISDRDELIKIAIVSKAVVPDVALIDPETTKTMDSYLTACTGMDALVHAIEAFVSLGAGGLTDGNALESIKLITQYLPKALEKPQNNIFREKVMLASLKAGLAFSNASLGAVHAMAHSLGGYLDLAHGECNSILLDYVIDYNFDSTPERFRTIGETMGIDTRGLHDKEVKKKLMKTIARLKRQVGITKQLKQKGVTSSDIPLLSKKAVKDACMLTNPRNANEKDLEVIFENAM